MGPSPLDFNPTLTERVVFLFTSRLSPLLTIFDGMLVALEEMYSIFYQLNQNASIMSPIFAFVLGGSNVTPL